ncbi:hypothetical protein, partial [Rhodococcus koreensis]|uniref:hypothetical protein n=1 Tax=Rhodococcus koreensis TaxID=99653 RepID=UPI0036D78B5B
VAVVAVVMWALGSDLINDRRKRIKQRRGRGAELARRADAQHEQYLAGDDRGVYGGFRPVDLDRVPKRLRRLPSSPGEWRAAR